LGGGGFTSSGRGGFTLVGGGGGTSSGEGGFTFSGSAGGGRGAGTFSGSAGGGGGTSSLPLLLDCSLDDAMVLTVYNRIKLQVDLQEDKSPIVVKGPFFLQLMNPRYQIRGTKCDARVDLIKPRNFDLQEVKPMHLIPKNILKTNLIYEIRR
jgi:hypothetical protein